MFAVTSVDAAKLYYESLKNLQVGSDKPLRIATIFSYAANEEQDAIGDIQDESFDVSAMNSSAKEFLDAAIADYNGYFKTSFSVDSNGFQNYYRDLAKRVKSREIDLLIVVGMFLTGFDAPTLNTLFVDKNLRYHGLIQAYSRTNRIYDATKTFGNIVTFRDLQQATVDAITLFGDSNTKNVVLENSYKEYMEGFTDVATGEARRGFKEVVAELEKRFPNPEEIVKEKDKKEFAKLFGEYLRVENILQNFDEFASLKQPPQNGQHHGCDHVHVHDGLWGRFARSEGDRSITLNHLERACLLEGIDSMGLGPTEQRYLRIVSEGPTRLNVIASRLGLPTRTVAEVVEPFLIRSGMVVKDDGGKRQLTAEGHVQVGNNPAFIV